ncbi:MAG: hypothetical protein AB7U83_12745 [Vicinamibacterales bacterium]
MTPPAPAAAWAVCLCLVAPLGYGLAEQAVAAARGASAADPQIANQIGTFLTGEHRPNRPRGVMLGISGGWCAFEGADDGPPAVLPVAAIGQGLHELYPYLGDIVAGRPDFILIQSTALVTASAPPSPYRVARRRLRERFLSPLLRRRAAFKEGVVAGAGHDICARLAQPHDRWDREVSTDIAWISQDLGDSSRERLRQELARLIDSGIPILVFAQPRNRHSAAYHRLLDDRVDALLRPLGDRRRALTMLRYPEIEPDESFYEPLHLAPAGAAAFRRRLFADIDRVLDGGAGGR